MRWQAEERESAAAALRAVCARARVLPQACTAARKNEMKCLNRLQEGGERRAAHLLVGCFLFPQMFCSMAAG